MRDTHHDVIVIGAGTSGASVARALVGSGRSVLLIDRDATALRAGDASPRPLYRPPETDFGAVTHFDGTSPAWPIDAAELADALTDAERLCDVRGGVIDPRDPAEPAIQAMLHRFRAAGLHPFPTPTGVVPAGAPAGCDVLTGRALHFETDASGREIHAVVVDRGDRTVRRTADLFVLAAGAIGSPAILLRSTEANAEGLANRSGVVGRNLVRRHRALVFGLMKREPPATIGAGFTIHDFYRQAPGWRHPGGHIRLAGTSYHEAAPAVWTQWAATAAHSVDFDVAAEGLPHADNHLAIDRDGRAVLHWRPTNATALRKLSAHLSEALASIGAPSIRAPRLLDAAPVTGGDFAGSIRMGRDPATSGVDPSGRAHDVANLWVADASAFPSAGAIDPTLLRVAFALHAAAAAAQALGGAGTAAPRPEARRARAGRAA